MPSTPRRASTPPGQEVQMWTILQNSKIAKSNKRIMQGWAAKRGNECLSTFLRGLSFLRWFNLPMYGLVLVWLICQFLFLSDIKTASWYGTLTEVLCTFLSTCDKFSWVLMLFLFQNIAAFSFSMCLFRVVHTFGSRWLPSQTWE